MERMTIWMSPTPAPDRRDGVSDSPLTFELWFRPGRHRTPNKNLVSQVARLARIGHAAVHLVWKPPAGHSDGSAGATVSACASNSQAMLAGAGTILARHL